MAAAARCVSCKVRATCSLSSKAAAAAPRPALPEQSVFRRPLPTTLVRFASRTGKLMFSEALRGACSQVSLHCEPTQSLCRPRPFPPDPPSDGTAEPYFPLSEQYVTQQEISFCALGSLTMVMNALGVDPRRRWRDESGPGWRWWDDEMFTEGACLPSLDDLRREGAGLAEFAVLAAANGAAVNSQHAEASSERSFRKALAAAARLSDSFVVVNFDRSALGQTGCGHFSPVAGYHAASDSVLVLDVARFKYPPFWVPVPALWEATRSFDADAGASRGWLRLSAWDGTSCSRLGASETTSARLGVC